MGLFRRKRLPAERRPPLERDERVVAWAVARDGAVLVATTLGLWLPEGSPAPDGSGGQCRMGWHEIHKATWDGADLVVIGSQALEDNDGWQVVADVPPRAFALTDPGELPHQVRARVTRSVGPSTHHPLSGAPGGAGVRVVGRRVPGRDGLFWTVRYDAGINHDDPVVREVTADLVAQSRAAVPTQ